MKRSNKWAGFFADEQGGVIILVALLIVVLLGTTALAIDTGVLYQNRRELVNIADAAALAGAQELPHSTADARIEAKAYASANGYELTDDQISFENNNRRIVIDISRESSTYFASILNSDFRTVDIVALSAAERLRENLWDSVGFIESYYDELQIKDNVNFYIDSPEGYKPVIHSNQRFEVKNNVNADVEVYGTWVENQVQDYADLFEDTRQVAWKEPPITAGNIDDLISGWESQGLNVMIVHEKDDQGNFIYDFVDTHHDGSAKIELKNQSVLDFSTYGDFDGDIDVVYFSGRELEVKESSSFTLTGAKLFILDCKFEVKDASTLTIDGAIHVFSQGSHHELEFKNDLENLYFNGPILVDGKLQIWNDVDVNFDLTNLDQIPEILIDGRVSLVR